MTSYKTILAPAEARLDIKRSIFIGNLYPVTSEEEARQIIQGLKKQHWDARHHCSAFIIGPPLSEIERSNDDGEPSGTAGPPMLDALKEAGVSDTLAVVTRWFGGVLLGAGGLTRAYRDSVRASLELATFITRRQKQLWTLTIPHQSAGKIEAELRQRGWVSDVTYQDQVTISMALETHEIEAAESTVAYLTSGEASLIPGEFFWQ